MTELVILEFNATLTAKTISWRLVTHMCFLVFSHQYKLTQLFFPKPPTTFLTWFCRGERRKYSGKIIRLNRGSNSQPPGHESDTLTTEPPGWACRKGEYMDLQMIPTQASLRRLILVEMFCKQSIVSKS